MQTSNVELPAQKRQISLVPGLTSPYATNAQKPSVLDKDLVPSRLKALWSEVEAGRLTTEEFCAHERELIRGYAEIWADALLLPGEHDLQRSVCVELGNLVGSDDLADIERKCRSALHDMRDQWNAEVKKGDVIETLNYYDKSSHYSYELMWWHSLVHDQSPLAYVVALHLALQNGFKDSLDFGSGVGSGGLLFSKHGFSISLGDVSSTLLDFSRRRLQARGIPATYIDLKTTDLPAEQYDFITAMDVFEHIAQPEKAIEPLVKALRPGGIVFGRFNAKPDEDHPSHIAEPEKAVEPLARALRPGGILFGRLNAKPDEDHPSHITYDFAPTFKRLTELGLDERWRDEWLWGHQAFRKAREPVGSC